MQANTRVQLRTPFQHPTPARQAAPNYSRSPLEEVSGPLRLARESFWKKKLENPGRTTRPRRRRREFEAACWSNGHEM